MKTHEHIDHPEEGLAGPRIKLRELKSSAEGLELSGLLAYS